MWSTWIFKRIEGPALVGAFTALVGLLAALGPLADYFIADALVPIHVSLTRWEPYYWGQARYGMLVPLVALPFREPLVNYFVQNWLTAALGVGVFFLLAARFERGAPAVTVGAWSLALYLLFDQQEAHRFYLSPVSQYGTGMSLGLAGSLLWQRWEKWARAAGAFFVVLALWVDISLVLFLVPLELGIWLYREGGLSRLRKAIETRSVALLGSERSVSFMLVLGATFLVEAAMLPKARTSDAHELLGFAPMATWSAGWANVTDQFVRSMGSGAGIALACILAVGLFVGVRVRATRRETTSVVAIVIAMIGLRTLVLGASLWVHENAFEAKYMIPSRLLLFTLPALLSVRAVAWFAPSRLPGLAVVGLVTTLLALEFRYPVRTFQAMRLGMNADPKIVMATDEIKREGCTHLVGWDQTVWPIVFHAAQVAYKTKSPIVAGISSKSDPASVTWTALSTPAFKLCAPIGDRQVRPLSENLGWPPLRIVREHLVIDVLQEVTPVSATK